MNEGNLEGNGGKTAKIQTWPTKDLTQAVTEARGEEGHYHMCLGPTSDLLTIQSFKPNFWGFSKLNWASRIGPFCSALFGNATTPWESEAKTSLEGFVRPLRHCYTCQDCLTQGAKTVRWQMLAEITSGQTYESRVPLFPPINFTVGTVWTTITAKLFSPLN